MKYIQYGLTLTRLREEDIEMVRNWRNSPQVVKNYAYREYITPEMQKEWFKSIGNIYNTYMIIEYRKRKIGVINVKNLDWDNRICESGIFIPDPDYQDTYIPAIVSIIMTDLFFKHFHWDKIYCHTLKTNLHTIQFNKRLGYELCPAQEKEENQLYCLTAKRFSETSVKLKKALLSLTGTDETSVFIIEPSDMRSGIGQKYEEVIRDSKFLTKVEKTRDGKFYYFS
jgi:RimJ/RimL family protein N-acetyltransferase